MVQPIDYTLGGDQAPQGILQGVQTGMGLQAAQQQATNLEAQRSQMVSELISNPNATADDYARVAAIMPKEQGDNLRASWQQMDKAKQEGNLKSMGDVFAAFNAGNSEFGVKLLEQRAEAERNSGNEQGAGMFEAMAQTAKVDPNATKVWIGSTMAAVPGGKEYLSGITEIGQPALESQKAEIEQQKVDIRKKELKARAIDAQISRETNELKKKQLQQELDKTNREIEQTKRSQIIEVKKAKTRTDNSLAVVDRILNNPQLDNILGSVQGSEWFPSTLVGLVIPGQDTDQMANAQADIETLTSQQFLNNLQEAKAGGATFGALTEREGERLVNAVTSLNQKQGEKQFRDNLNTIRTLLQKSKKELDMKYDLGDEPSVGGAAMSLDERLAKYGIK